MAAMRKTSPFAAYAITMNETTFFNCTYKSMMQIVNSSSHGGGYPMQFDDCFSFKMYYGFTYGFQPPMTTITKSSITILINNHLITSTYFVVQRE
jgi:hypothetical protein